MWDSLHPAQQTRVSHAQFNRCTGEGASLKRFIAHGETAVSIDLPGVPEQLARGARGGRHVAGTRRRGHLALAAG